MAGATTILVILLLVPALSIRSYATTPTHFSNTFKLAGPPTITHIRHADGNTIIQETQNITETGPTINGTEVSATTFILKSSGDFVFHATNAFTGTVNGVSGTLTFKITAEGSTVSGLVQGHFVIVSGTAGLSNLRGEGTFQASLATGNGTETGQIHFDPSR